MLEEGAGIMRELKEGFGGAYHVWGLGKVNALRGRPLRAARLWGAAEALRERMGMSLSQFDLAASGYERDLAAMRSTLSEASFDAAWAEGRAMSPEEAVEYAREAVEEPVAAPPTMVPKVSQAGSSSEKPAPMAPPELLRVFALGPARVERDGRVLASSERTYYAKPKELLIYLLSHPSMTKAQIGLALWPDASPRALRGNFHITLHRLRKALGGSEWVLFEKGHYSFNRSLDCFFDVEAF